MKALEEALEKRETKQISTNYLTKLAKFVLQSNYLEFNKEVKNRLQDRHASSWIRLNLVFENPTALKIGVVQVHR